MAPRVRGQGAYYVRGGRLGAGNQVPSFGNLRPTTEGGVVVCHREYVQDIRSSASGSPSSFEATGYAINPGNPQLFPWLSTIAMNFEQYKIRGMLMQFRTTSGNSVAAANTALGTITMATDYNSAQPLFTTKEQMANYAHGQTGVPSEDIVHQIEVKRGNQPVSTLYVRGPTVPTGQDVRLYDFGNFQIATSGMQANNTNLGELWVTYCIELVKPRMATAAEGPDVESPAMDHFILDVVSLSSTDGNYFGNVASMIVPTYEGLGCRLTKLPEGIDSFVLPGYGLPPHEQLPIGTKIRIDYAVLGTSATLTDSISFDHGANWAGQPAIYIGPNNGLKIAAGVSSSAQWFVAYFEKVDTQLYADQFWIQQGTLPTSPTYADLWVSIIPHNIV